MGDVLTIVFGIGVMMSATWMAVFGAGGACLARSFGQSMVVGALLGCALGPVGWFITWFPNRANRT